MKKYLYSFYFCFIAACLMAMSNCAVVDPLRQAETTGQRAYALYGTYVIFVEKAADIVESPNVPPTLKLRLIAAEEKAAPIVESLIEVLFEYERIEREVKAQTTPPERLLAVSRNLETMLLEATPLIEVLINTVRGSEI